MKRLLATSLIALSLLVTPAAQVKAINGDLGWNAPLLNTMKAYGWQGERVGFGYGATDPDQWPTNHNLLKIQDVLDHGMQPLVITWTAAQVSWLPSGVWVEAGNEPLFGTESPKMSPAYYAKYVVEPVVRAANTRNLQVFIGAQTLDKDNVQWLKGVVQSLPSGLTYGVSFHVYPRGETLLGAPTGYSSIDQALSEARLASGGRLFIISETGMWTAPRCTGFWFWRQCKSWTPEYIANQAQDAYLFFHRKGAQMVVWYQILDGPNPQEKEDTFGVFSPNYSSAKPVIDRTHDGY